MTPWLDGLSVLAGEWRLVVAVIVCMFAGQALIGALLKSLFGASLTSSERLALGLAGWTVPASLLALLWYLTGFDGLFWILPAALILVLFLRGRGRVRGPIFARSAPRTRYSPGPPARASGTA